MVIHFSFFIVDDDNLIGLDPLSRFLDCQHTYINASRVLVRIKLIEVLFFNYFNKRLAKTKRVVRSLLQLKASLILSLSFPSSAVLHPLYFAILFGH